MPTSGVQYKLDPTPEPSDEEEESEEEEDDGFGSSKKKGEELDPAASKFQFYSTVAEFLVPDWDL
jgi:hypothetical protein